MRASEASSSLHSVKRGNTSLFAPKTHLVYSVWVNKPPAQNLAVEDFAARLDRLDSSLFNVIPSQSSVDDRMAWLAVQRSVRGDGYVYLETGSYMGGSIQQHLLDPKCKQIISIDRRQLVSSDDRPYEELVDYPENSTELMLEWLQKVGPGELGKVKTFDTDASEVDAAEVIQPPKMCFIDGEHTRAAVLSDFQFCLKLCDPDAAICFHDAWIVSRALEEVLTSLNDSGISFSARRLGGDTFAIFLRNCPAKTDTYIRSHSSDGLQFLKRMRRRQAVKALVPKWARSPFRYLFPAP